MSPLGVRDTLATPHLCIRRITLQPNQMLKAAITACLLVAEAPLLFGQHSMQLQESSILIVSQPSRSVLAQLLLGMDLLQHRQVHKALAADALTCTQLLLPWKPVPGISFITKTLLVRASCQQSGIPLHAPADALLNFCGSRRDCPWQY